MPPTRLALIGFGSVNQTLSEIVNSKNLHESFKVVGVSDSGGAIFTANGAGIDTEALRQHKAQGRGSCVKFAKQLGDGVTVVTSADASLQLANTAEYDVLVDCSPSNIQHAQPGLDCVRAALKRKRHVVLANKSPLVLAYAELVEMAQAAQVRLSFSATVCGGLPVVNVGQRDLVYGTVTLFQGVLNSTSNFILSKMAEGVSNEDALKVAQEAGIAEADPSLDVQGWDTASKLVIVANAVLGFPCTLKDVTTVDGVESVTKEELEQLAALNQTKRLVATARLASGSDSPPRYELDVKLTVLPKQSPLGGCVDTDMAVYIESDIYENWSMKTDEKGVFPTSAAVLRDLHWVRRDFFS